MLDSPFQKDSAVIQHLNNDLKLSDASTLPTEIQQEKLLSWLCSVPKYTTYRINTLSTTANEMADMISSEFEKQGIRRGGNVALPEVSVHPVLSEVVVVGNWEEKSLNLRPQEKEVIVDAACGVAVLRGAHVFAPGVMGMQTGVQNGDYVSVYADIARQCKRGLQRSYTDSKVFVGNGIAKMGRKQLYGKDVKLMGIAVEMMDIISGCPSLGTDCPPSDLALLQNLPSVVCCRALGPCPGETVLDLCAAPGNKTSHLAMLMENQGLIIALDKTEPKINNIRKRCEQFSLSCVKAYVCDSTKAVLEPGVQHKNNSNTVVLDKSKTHSEINKRKVIMGGPPYVAESFDRVLLDAPCSALGQRPQLVNDISVKQLKSYPPLQKKLFLSAVMLLKPGGHLVYSTCTVTVAENEALVRWALHTFPYLRLKPTEPTLGGPGLAGVGLTEEQRHCVQRFGPPEYNESTVGFFIATFVKELAI